MAHGRLTCLGSAQHLKSKFGHGYQLELKANIPQMGDQDVRRNLLLMGRRRLGVSEEVIESKADQMFFGFNDAIAALQALSGDNFLSTRVTAENAMGYIVHKEANSETGVSLSDLAHFATTLFRMRNIDVFVRRTYSSAVLREWQDLKARYEISADGLSIAHIFETVERHRASLQVEDYGVSQTSLEQVFNQHAAEALQNAL